MGYNSILAIRYSDLDRIAETPEFASVLSRCAQRLNMAPGKTIASSELPGVSTDWEFRLSCCTHSSGLAAAVVGGDQMIGARLSAWSFEQTRRQDWVIASRLLARHGYEAKATGRMIAAAADPVPTPFDLEARIAAEEDRLAAHNADPGNSVLAFTVLHDGFYATEADTGLGLRMRETAERYVDMHPHFMDGVRRGLFYSRGDMNLRMGDIGNGMSLIGLVPCGRHELVLMGGNHGRFLDQFLPIGAHQNPSRREANERIRAGDIEEITRELNGIGISLKAPGRNRHSPLRASARPFALPETGNEPEEGPHTP